MARPYRTLAAYLAGEGVSHADLAARLGVTTSYVTQLANKPDARTPSLKIALKIEEQTGIPVRELAREVNG